MCLYRCDKLKWKAVFHFTMQTLKTMVHTFQMHIIYCEWWLFMYTVSNPSYTLYMYTINSPCYSAHSHPTAFSAFTMETVWWICLKAAFGLLTFWKKIHHCCLYFTRVSSITLTSLSQNHLSKFQAKGFTHPNRRTIQNWQWRGKHWTMNWPVPDRVDTTHCTTPLVLASKTNQIHVR